MIEQEKFLRNMPKALDERIVQEVPNLARAIAAEHLLQVFLTHGADMDRAENRKELVAWLDLCGAELNVSKITDALLVDGSVDRERFAELMCSSAASSRRDYDV